MTVDEVNELQANFERNTKNFSDGCATMVEPMPIILRALDGGPLAGTIAGAFTPEMLEPVRQLHTALGEFLERVERVKAGAN